MAWDRRYICRMDLQTGVTQQPNRAPAVSLLSVNPHLPAGEYMSLAEIATFTGLSLKTLRSYRSRPLKENPFPDPLPEFESAEIWTKAAIEKWVSDRPGKGRWGPREADS